MCLWVMCSAPTFAAFATRVVPSANSPPATPNEAAKNEVAASNVRFRLGSMPRRRKRPDLSCFVIFSSIVLTYLLVKNRQVQLFALFNIGWLDPARYRAVTCYRDIHIDEFGREIGILG